MIRKHVNLVGQVFKNGSECSDANMTDLNLTAKPVLRIFSTCGLATALLPNRTTESFQIEAGPPYDKQRIQMGLRSGNTVLIYFRSGVGHYQSVLIALAADLHTNKPWQGQHKFWKYVSPIRTYFAWLPEQLARTYCSAALDRRTGLPYGDFFCSMLLRCDLLAKKVPGRAPYSQRIMIRIWT